MGSKDVQYQIIYRGQTLEYYYQGAWVFFQRPKESGGGFWLGRVYDDVFMIEYERPVSLSEGYDFLLALKKWKRKVTSLTRINHCFRVMKIWKYGEQ